MHTQPTEWTVEKVRSLPDDGNRYEVIDGELFVTSAPSWTHQRAVRGLLLLIDPYVSEYGIGDTMIAPAEVVFGPRNMVEPDFFVVPLIGDRIPQAWDEVGRLLLVVEVLSPSTVRTDRREKRALYQSKAVPEYWIVDIAARTVTRWRPDDVEPEIQSRLLEWQPDAGIPPLRIDLPSYFERVTGVAE